MRILVFGALLSMACVPAVTQSPADAGVEGASVDAGVDAGVSVTAWQPGDCGFDSAPAFCAKFEDAPSSLSRAGELSPALWSGMRAAGDLGSPFGNFVRGDAPISNCRADLDGTMATANRDIFLCHPTAHLDSGHLLMVSAAQNYGLLSLRLRQPIDFAGRAAVIRFDVDLHGSILGGWPAVVLSQDPTPAPSFDYPERGSGPRNGVELEFVNGWCNTPGNAQTPMIYMYADYLETVKAETVAPATYDCALPHVTTAEGQLNRVEVRVSQTSLVVSMSDVSADGKTFGPLKQVYSGTLSLPFTRGYLNFIVRNHATEKYGYGPAWYTRWDNIGFDGPALAPATESSFPDPLTPEQGGHQGLATNYVVPSMGDPNPVSIALDGVHVVPGAQAALVWTATYPTFEWNGVSFPPQHINLRWRLNGHPWHDRFITDVEAGAFQSFSGDIGAGGAGLFNQQTAIDASELSEGHNVLELQSDGTWTGTYAVGVTAIDLIQLP